MLLVELSPVICAHASNLAQRDLEMTQIKQMFMSKELFAPTDVYPWQGLN